MSDVLTAFPRRPMRLRVPSGNAPSRIWSFVGFLACVGILTAIVLFLVPNILTDAQVRETATIAEPSRVESGECNSRLFVHLCTATLVLGTRTGEVRRDVVYGFVDPHFGSYTVKVLADLRHTEWVTTDLGLDMFWNRVATAVVLAVLLVLGIFGSLRRMFTRGSPAQIVASYSGQSLTPVPLTLTARQRVGRSSFWTVKSDQGPAFRWKMPRKLEPFVLAPPSRVLGVVGPQGGVPFPLDSGLTLVDMTDAERAALRSA